MQGFFAYMNTKINHLTALALLSSTILAFTPASANAAIFDWLGVTKPTDIQSNFISFAGIGKDMGINLLDKDSEPSSFELLQGSSLVATNNPLSIKRVVKTQNRTYVVPASAYSSTIDQTDHSPFITARGTHVRDGVVAANFLPFGTVIKIPEIYGDKTFIVEDRMNSRYFYKIDVWFPSRAEAKEFGVKKIKIEIVS